MSTIDVTDWIPEEHDSEVIQRVQQMSAIEAWASRTPMSRSIKNLPRSAGVDIAGVAKSSPYGEDASANDEVTMTAQKIGTVVRLALEDQDDSLPNVIRVKQLDWATSYAKFIDNATLGVTAAPNPPTVPFESIYRKLSQTDSDVNYTGNDNITQSATADYDALSGWLAKLEDSDYFSEGIKIIASPKFRSLFRGVKDDQGMPIFVQGLAGTPDTLFGHEVRWSLGARKSAVATQNPNGNPLLIACNFDYVHLGVRSGPESMVAGADSGPAFLTDEALLKLRARRGFVLGHPRAAAIFEYTGA